MHEELIQAIRSGNTAELERMLTADPAMVHTRIDGQRTLLHVATDWPGHFPNVRETIALLVARGADVNARFIGRHTEAPLHWAASSEDIDALDALLDLGADIETPGSIIGGGAALADAVAFRQWKAARRLVERGAKTALWQAAALGLMDRLEQQCAASPAPPQREITNAFWNACHGGQLAAARFLLARGAEIDWVGHGGMTPLDTAARGGHTETVNWLREQGAV